MVDKVTRIVNLWSPMKVAGHKRRAYRMKTPRYQKPRTKRLDLYRRAGALGVTPSHLARVLRGLRKSDSLLARLHQLMEAEAREATKAQNPNAGQAALKQHAANTWPATPPPPQK